MDREAEIATKITQNLGVSFVFYQQNFANPRLVFCANFSHVIRKVWRNFQGKVGGEFTGFVFVTYDAISGYRMTL